MWISVRESKPQNADWVIVQTEDGSVFPATYSDKDGFSPVFRGGKMESLMHGSVLYWQYHEAGYQRVRCECGRRYLKTPDSEYCPLCAALKGKKPKAEKPKEEKPKVDAPAVVADAPAEEEAPKKTAPVKRTTKATTRKPAAKK